MVSRHKEYERASYKNEAKFIVGMTAHIAGISGPKAAKAVQFVMMDIIERVLQISDSHVHFMKSEALNELAKFMSRHVKCVGETYEGIKMTQRDYKKEYEDYQGTSEQKKRRAQRNAARRKAIEAGRAKKGDGKEVDHIGAPRTGSLDGVPTQVISKTANRIKQPKRS